MNLTLDERLERIEKCFNGVPGTTAGRVLLANSFCTNVGIPTDPLSVHEDTLVWSFMVGIMCVPKRAFYGKTLEEALSQAENALGLKEV